MRSHLLDDVVEVPPDLVYAIEDFLLFLVKDFLFIFYFFLLLFREVLEQPIQISKRLLSFRYLF